MVTARSTQQDEKKYYVYTLAYPDGRVFYVGKGTGRRINQHEIDARNPDIHSYKVHVIHKIWADGGQILKTKLAYFESEQDAFLLEIALIFLFESPLANLTYGGEGCSGAVRSEEHRRKLSEINRGRTLSEEGRRKISQANLGKPKPPFSEEHRRKLSEINRGRTLSEEHRRKLSQVRKGRIVSEETRLKMSEAHKGKVVRKGRIVSEETRLKMSEAHKGKVVSEETQPEMSSVQKGDKTPRHNIVSGITVVGIVYLNTTEACGYLGISRETLNNYVNAGRLHRYKRGIGRAAYYRQSDLDRLLEMRREDYENTDE